tara:strand:+ start:476 stop:733 length:258 start_codon:yes stop_codon:yes gene_type:complete
VGKPSGVEDEPGEPGIAPFVYLVDEGAFVVGLESVHFTIAGCGLGFYLFLDLKKRDGTVDIGFAFAEAIEVWAVEESDLFHLDLY